MGRAAKRARQKENRDRARAERDGALRRRRLVRLGVIGAILALVVGLAFVGAGDDDEPQVTAPGGPTLPKGCEQDDRSAPDAQQYETAPEMRLEDGVDYGAVVHTSCGDITMDLLERDAPETVNSFVFLAQDGYFNGLPWHRVERDAVLQTGDPNGENGVPPDGPGYTLPDELDRVQARDYVYGVVGMANPGQPDSGGSQWFIVIHDYEGAQEGNPNPATYPPNYTIFATVAEESWPVLQRLGQIPINADAQAGSAAAVQPKVPVYIDGIEITEG